MEMNFDKHVKQSLENYEMPYDSAAWTNLSKNLDQSMPVTPKSTTKWWIAASVSAIAVASALYFANSNSTSTPKDSAQAITTQDNNTTTATYESKMNTTTSSGISTLKTKQKDVVNVQEKHIETKDQASNYNENNSEPKADQLKVNEKNQLPADNFSNFSVPNISSACTGESLTITNKNTQDMIMLQPNSKKMVIAPHDNLHFVASAAGTYELGYMKDGAFVSKENFTVAGSPKAEIEIGEYEFESGLPTVHFNGNNVAQSYEWEVSKQTYTSKDIEAHFFKKGTYEVKLITTSTNGCTSTDKQKITIAEDYNLLATSAFSPTDDNSKNRTWIPTALKSRNVKFTLTIIDPVDGGIIYQTNDATQPWDGIDTRTGNLVPNNTNCIWTVKINNPEPGERADYKGVIIRL